jgi:hypothetical protein
MKTIGARVTGRDYSKIQFYLKEFRLNISDFIRKSVIHEIQRLKSLTPEEKKEEINDNVEWNRSKYFMSSKE